MSFTKRMMEQQWAQGWDFTDKCVCPGCVNEAHLAAAIAFEEDSKHACDFCGSSPAAPLNALMEPFVNGIRNAYGTADDEGVYWDGREGGYQASTLDSWDLVHYEFGELFKNEALMEAVATSMTEVTWVEKDFAWRRRDEVLIETWNEFCEAVKYKTRYVLWLQKDYGPEERWRTGEIPPALILDEIGRVIKRLGILIRTLPAGHAMWRARAHKTATGYSTAADLGTAPREQARANRMSPAGIGMFYGAEDAETAIAEVAAYVQDGYGWITVGEFQTSRPVNVVDFTNLPKNVNMFHPDLGDQYEQMRFLYHFVDELRRPAKDPQQIDYVPTQIITEYLLRVFEADEPIEGILYTSSVNGRTCFVMDANNDRCCDQGPHWTEADTLQLGLRSAETKELL